MRITPRAKKNIVRVLSQDGETHFVLREHTVEEDLDFDCMRLKNAEVDTFLKKEASKPLLLLRAE